MFRHEARRKCHVLSCAVQRGPAKPHEVPALRFAPAGMTLGAQILASPRPPSRGLARQERSLRIEVPARCCAASGTTKGGHAVHRFSSFVPFSPPPARRQGGTLFRAYRARLCACRRALAPARFARLIARARRRAHLSRAFLQAFFAPARTGRRGGPADAASFLLVYNSTVFLRSSLFQELFQK